MSSAEASAIISRLAGAQHGVFARRQALDAGIPAGLITGRIRNGWLTTIFKGVYSPALHGFINRRSTAIAVVTLTATPGQLKSRPSEAGRDFSVARHRTRVLPDRDLTEVEGIPVPVINTSLGDYLPDFLWRDQKLIIEVDGYKHHSGRGAFRVARLTDQEVMRDGVETGKRIRGLLELSRAER